MAEHLTFTCAVENTTAAILKLRKEQLDWGTWTDDNQYPIDVPAGATAIAFRSSGRANSASGTEGRVVYQLGADADTTLRIYWDVPWGMRANTLRVQPSEPDSLAVTVRGWVGEGPSESITLTVRDPRAHTT